MTMKESFPHAWSARIHQLIKNLGLTQAGLAERIGVSPATVSRWIQGKHEPTAECYVALGNLAGKQDGMYFWERAGIDTSEFPGGGLRQAMSSLQINLKNLTLVAGREVSQQLGEKGHAVAIPLLSVSAFGDLVPPAETVNLSTVEVEDVLLAPLAWCTHPEHVIAMHLAGDSMSPTISPGSIVFVDTASTEREKLNQKIAVVSHRDLGFKVARFQRLAGSDLLISANQKYAPLDISNVSKWKIFGEVLWWVSRDPGQAS